jgi:hypothetical protein
MTGDHVVGAEEEVHLYGLQLLVRAVFLESLHDDEKVVLVVIDLRRVNPTCDAVLDGQRVKAERLGQELAVFFGRNQQVYPEEAVTPRQSARDELWVVPL